MSKNEITVEDVYTLLVDVHKEVLEQKETIEQLKALLQQVPAAMDALGSNPMFKPFAKMLGIKD